MLKKCKDCKKNKSLNLFNMCGKDKSGNPKRRIRCSECHQKHRTLYWSEAQPEKLFKEYKKSAKERNLSFRLTLKQFSSFENRNCNYCGEKLDRIRLDRINNKVGYIITNIVPCCYICNKIKGSHKQDIFIEQIKKIYFYSLEIK